MKKQMTLSILMFLFTLSAFAAKIPAGTYTVDAAHSKIGFEIPHLVISTVEGRFNGFSGEVTVGDKLESLKVNTEIDANSIDTGIAKRDEHLKGADFFDTAKFPKITFVSKSVKVKGDKVTVTGDFTMHGVTKPLTFDAKYLGAVKDQSGKDRLAFSGEGKLKRKDFGLTWGKTVEAGPVVGEEVTIKLRIEANKK